MLRLGTRTFTNSFLLQAERIPLEKILRLSPPDGNKDHSWSAWDICEEFAKDRGFYTAKAARPDVYRGKESLNVWFVQCKIPP